MNRQLLVTTGSGVCKKGQLNETIIQKIYKMTKLYGRLVKEETEEKGKNRS